MLEKDEGIVLAASRSGDTSLRVTFLGRRAGKIRLMAKGALGTRHPARGLLEPGNHVEVVYYFREGRTLYFLKETALLAAPPLPRDSLDHMACLLAVTEILDQVCYSGAADADYVDLGVAFVQASAARDPLLLFLAFQLKLLGAAGSEPDLSSCASCGRALERGAYSAEAAHAYCPVHAAEVSNTIALTPAILEIARLCREESLQSVATRTVDRSARKALGRILHWTYTFHVQGYSLPKSLSLI